MQVLTIDIGGTKIAAALADQQGALSHYRTAPTPAQAGAQAVVAATIDLAREVCVAGRADGLAPKAVGVGAAGALDPAHGVVVYAGETLPGWAGTALAAELQAGLGLPVVVDNDVNVLALGELHAGAGRGFADLLVVAIGTGVGGALVVDGVVRSGATHSAGELGHLVVEVNGGRRCNCGGHGHLEAYASGPAIVARYQERLGRSDAVDLRQVAERARNGEPLASDVIVEGARILGGALAGLICVLDPQAVIIGGGVADLGDLWWPTLTAAVRANPLPGPAQVSLHPAQLGTRAVLVGAARLAQARFM